MTSHGGHGSWAAVARRWQDDDEFCASFSAALAAHPGEAFFWETVPSFRQTMAAPYQDVVVDAPALTTMRTDGRPFAEHLREGVVSFANLGGDATLVVPGPGPDEPREPYAHLAAFLRSAPEDRVRALWAELGRQVEERWARRHTPVWVSTSGLGVAWVHVRLDDRPKYYTHDPFRRFDPPAA